MKTLQLYTILLALFFIAFQGQAQGKRNGEKIDAARTAYLTDKMNLNAEQAQRFWPLYNEYDAKRRDLRRQGRPFKGKEISSLTDAQLKDQLDKMWEIRQKELELDKTYAEKFQKVISVRQLAALYQGEREFTRVLLKKLHDKPKN